MSTRARRQNTRLRFERWAANPTCHANVGAVVHNVSMAAVARHENPAIHVRQSSELAFQRGILFERSLLRDGARRLLDELRRDGHLDTSTPTHFHDFRVGPSGSAPRDVDEALDRSRSWLTGLRSLPSGMHVLAGLVLRIPRGIMLPEATLVLDVTLVFATAQPARIMVGEVKSYADRGGYTKSGSLASARAQAGLYVHAMELVIRELEMDDSCSVSTNGFLVLAKPGSNFPSVRWNEDLRWQAERARRGFQLLEESALALNGAFAFDEDLPEQQLIDLVLRADTDFRDSCIGVCERAPTCQRSSVTRDDGAFLGDDVVRFLNGIPLSRAEALVRGAEATTGAEADLLRRMEGGVEEPAIESGEG